MSSETAFVLIQRLADGTVEWIPLEVSPQRVPVAPNAAYTLVDRANYEAPQALEVQRVGENLVVEVEGTEVLALEGFFTNVDVTFYPTTNIAGGAGPFSGTPLTADSAVFASAAAAGQVVSSAGSDDRDDETGAHAEETGAGGTAAGGGSSPLLWVGVAAGGLGLAAAAGGGGGGSSGGGSGPPVADTIPPQITSGTTAVGIAENSGAGQVVYTATATDAGAITYSLRAGGDAVAFSINANTGAVTLTGNPDYETKSSYSFTVAATDAANNSAERAVTLAINNLDDTVDPVTITSGTTAAVDENSGPARVVYTVTATATGAVTYSLKPDGDAAAFTINATTGAVTLIANPDDETKGSYAFTVVATDAAGHFDEQAVSLQINDLDEVAPAITSGTAATAINENSGPDQVVYTVSSTDTADISTGSTTYSLKAGGDAAAFTIDATTGAVGLTGNPDFETTSSYSFTVVATDAAGNSNEQAVSLAIDNRDEVAPIITSGVTATAITENSGAGQVVYTVTSTDTGDIATGSTTYSIKAGGDGADFTINANTGAVTLIGNPDYETKSRYNFTVVATDAASNSAEQAVSLTLNNVNDTGDLVFITSGATAAPVDENIGPARVVYTVTATATGAVTYSLKPGDDAAAFTINSTTGAVTLTGNPNYEAKPSYHFTVVATDPASNRGEQAVSLAINNRDEVPPIITSAATAAVNENIGPGQVVYTVTSTDADVVSGSTSYRLKAGGDAAAFTINASTGAVTLIANPDDETKGSYAFTVVATDAAGNFDEQAVSLQINDLDEVAPTITSAATAAVNENIGPGQVVYTVTSTDTGDITTGSTTYSLKAGGDAAAFTINATTGAVTLTANPDDETKGSYAFTVVATDAAGNFDEQPVSLQINDLDEVAPTITSGPIATAINENTGPGQVVYTVTSTDTGDIATGSTTYSLQAGGDAALFTINATTGAVTLTANPDDETKGSYAFTVVATDAAGHFDTQAVSLQINDLDEVAPTITSGPTASAINENSGPGQVVYTVTSTDTGDIATGSTTYSLKAGGDAAAFTINGGTGVVTLTGNPNFETKPSYNFTVVATDAANNFDEQAVSLAINNLDEVAPTITSGPTASAINENSGPGQVVYTVTSTDTGDIATGSTTYSLQAGGDAALFTINATTGAVTLTANPDDETKGSYAFTVVATDAAGHFDTQAVSLQINDLDEVAPTITSGGTATPINENSGAGQVVYTVTSTDTGDIATGSTTYSLMAGGDAAAFTINSATGAVTLTGNPDFETKSSYNFTVVATDAAGNNDTQAVSLAINNLDEVAPTITSGPTATPINENSGAGQAVYTVAATDAGTITYSLKAGGDAAAFTINGGTGVVTLTGNPNFETKPSYNFTVVATDAANNFDEQAVSLAINNLDEVAPTITSGPTASAINENSGPGQVVYTVTSTDTGDIATGSTTYSLQAGGDAALFTINATTGAVTLTANPDDETKGSYAFTVVATDAAGHFDTQAVSLQINDLDEVAPTITSAATAAVDENIGAGQVVYTVTSTDTGDIATGSTTYSLQAGGDAALFTINATTGAVTLTANPDDETKGSYAFTVVATDAAGHFDTQAVSLQINDLDEVAPTITSGGTATPINENSGAGQVVYTVTSTDTGDIATGSTTYSLMAGGDAAAFTINSATGAVTLTGNPDFETKSSYNFTVVATDAAGNNDTQAVSLAINNLDEVAPTITSGPTATPINENSGAGQAVYTVAATDAGTITYSLKAGGDAAAFTINGGTGVVTLTGNPNFETKPSYNFTVVATDAANNFDEQAVSLAINNLDEVAPTITSGPTASAINENSGPGQVVYTVTSTDTGDIATGSTTYSLQAGGDAALFTINATTGAVTLTANPDDETKGSYAFTVVATDAAGHFDTQAVSLQINDLDEVAPTITSAATAAVDENIGAGQVVYTVTSTDTGDIATGSTTYSLTGGDAGFFSINANSGAVTLIGNPDFETTSSYNFTVVATDAAGNSDTLAVSLAINNLDEVAPTITSADNAAVDENIGAGQVVYTVTSTDTGDISTGSTTYSLKAGGDAAAFSIDANTGAVTLTGDPDFESQASYNFTVVATDAASNSSEQAVSLAINDLVEGSASAGLIFEDTTQLGVDDSDGSSIASKALGRSNGSIAGHAGDLSDAAVASNPSFGVDATAPTLSSRTPADDAIVVPRIHDIVLNFSDDVLIDGGNIVISSGLGSGLSRDSSSDDSRTPQSRASEEIDIRVAVDDATLSAATWSGSADLGSDDRARLVGNDPALPDQMSITDGIMAWQSEASPAGSLEGTSLAKSAPFEGALLESGEGQTHNMSFGDIPAVLLTSQGLA